MEKVKIKQVNNNTVGSQRKSVHNAGRVTEIIQE